MAKSSASSPKGLAATKRRVWEAPILEGDFERAKHANGKRSYEFALKKGMRHGAYRRRHENGVPAEKGSYRNGQLHGKVSKWNKEGRLLGTSTFDNGTGLVREWHDNGQSSSECSVVSGVMTGRMRVWAEDGMLYVQRFFFEGRPISKKVYQQKCASMPDLPRFAEDKITNTLGTFMRRLRQERRAKAKLGPSPEDLEAEREFDGRCDQEVKKKTSREVLAWLTKSRRPTRELGEMTEAQARGFGGKLYSVGARKVWVTNIERDGDGSEYAKNLIVALPKDGNQHGKLYELCADPARPFFDGRTPAIRMSQRYMKVALQ